MRRGPNDIDLIIAKWADKSAPLKLYCNRAHDAPIRCSLGFITAYSTGRLEFTTKCEEIPSEPICFDYLEGSADYQDSKKPASQAPPPEFFVWPPDRCGLSFELDGGGELVIIELDLNSPFKYTNHSSI